MTLSRMLVLVAALAAAGCGDDDAGVAGDADAGTSTGTDASASSNADAARPDAAPIGGVPVVMLNHPGNGETRSASSDIPFIGAATDPEDGALTGAALVWTSNLDGQIGTGQSFTRRLSAGSQVITLTARDSAGNSASASITLTITP